jgi:uncharacterized metal-binding protein
MPAGNTHNFFVGVAGVGMGIGCVYLEQDITYTLSLVSGSLAGLILTPDLDVDTGCTSMRLVRGGCGRLVSTLWQWYWLPYSKVMPHRGISHTPILGTLTRLVYFIPFLFVFVLWYTHTELWLWVVGLMVSDTIHWGLDKLDSLLWGKL